MTYSTLNFEREYDLRYQERIAILCEPAQKDSAGNWIIPEPTPAQKRLARADADAAVRFFREMIVARDAFGMSE